MKKWLGILFTVLLLFSAVTRPAAAQQGNQIGRDPKFEEQIAQRLGKISPEAVPLFQAATAALDKNDLKAAQAGFEQVLALAPNFPDALRRLSQVYYYSQQNNAQAEKLARQALEAAKTPENQSWLAMILIGKNTPASNTEAYYLGVDAAKAQPDDYSSQYACMVASALTDHIVDLRRSTAVVLRLSPNNPDGHYFNALLMANDQNWEQAESELRLAKTLGMPAEIVQHALDSGITAQATLYRSLRWGLYGLVGWVVVLGLLFLAGTVLSRATLASVNRMQGLTRMEISTPERAMRQVYRVVIAITSAYFYISIPILILLVLAILAGFAYLFFTIGRIPIRLAVIVLIASLYTLYAVVRSLFIRPRRDDPGKELARGDSPALWELLEETARRVGTRPVDKVFLAPGTTIGVYERGSWLKRLSGNGERCLILGLGALPGMNQGQLRAIIAHEYGHFNHADTAGGDLAHAVVFNIHTMAQGLAGVGTATWYNPVWWFINGYYRIFLRITAGASRLQEILADRYATVQYGVRNMKSGLEHVIRQDLQFSEQVNGEIKAAVQSQRGLQNLYTLPDLESGAKVEEAFNKAMQEKTSVYASHPSARDRLAFIERVQNSGLVQEDYRPAWNLLSDPDRLQDEVTKTIERNLTSQGVLRIAAGS